MNLFKKGGLYLLGSLIVAIVSIFIDCLPLFLLAMVAFMIGCGYILVGIFKFLKRKLKGIDTSNIKLKFARNNLIDEEVVVKIAEVGDCFNIKIVEVEQQQTFNRQEKDKLQNELNDKVKEKKQYDLDIKNFTKANTYNLKLGTSIDMISNVLIHNSKFTKLEDITSVQVQCNSQVITQTNTIEERKARKGLVSTMGRAAVGVALTGGTPMGAVLGLTGTKKTKGRSSTTTTQKEMCTYKVVVLTNGIGNSIVSINCGNSEEVALKISNAINNACMNIGMVDTTKHEANKIKSDELGFTIQDLRKEVQALDRDYNELKNVVRTLKKECSKEVKQLKRG